MGNILLFIKDFELGSKASAACVDHDKKVEFCDENSNPDDFVEKSLLAIIDLDEAVFFSVGLVSELKRHGIKILGTMEKVNTKELKKLRSAGCDIVLPKSSLVKNIPKLLSELIS